MVHMIAAAIAHLFHRVLEALDKRFISLVLDEIVLVGNPTEQVIWHGMTR
jgi:type IV secretory pathway VirB3-like protein